MCKTDDLNSNNLKAVFKSAVRILIFHPSDAGVILSLSGDSVISGCHFILNSVKFLRTIKNKFSTFCPITGGAPPAVQSDELRFHC